MKRPRMAYISQMQPYDAVEAKSGLLSFATTSRPAAAPPRPPRKIWEESYTGCRGDRNEKGFLQRQDYMYPYSKVNHTQVIPDI